MAIDNDDNYDNDDDDDDYTITDGNSGFKQTQKFGGK